jgi:hypothetical protein
MYPHLIPFQEVCKRLGIVERTGYNKVYRKCFPVPIKKVDGRNYVLSTDLENYFDSLSLPSAPPPRRRGRPSRTCV